MTEPTKIKGILDDLVRIYEQQDKGAVLDVKHPVTGDRIGLKILVAGYESERMKETQRRVVNQRLRHNSRSLKPTAEGLEAQNNETIAATILSWEWDRGVSLAGERPEATPAGIAKVFKLLPCVPAQVDAFAGNLANFADQVDDASEGQPAREPAAA